ncbi:MAG: MBL fold metallo-hydrolase [Proteobacteria bacterium]|nr:MBL fold metallo-hydrolase [Pseudomonadota bacterium]
MRILNIGGATAIIEHAGKRILFDPWMDEGIFHGAWYHYPPSAVKIKDLGHLDYVYISHIHEDHCSAGTIKHLNEDAEIILLDKKPNFVAKFLDNYRFKFKKIHLIKPKTPTMILPNLCVDMLTGDPANPMAYALDSTLILKWDDFVLVNANDCIPYKDGLDYILSTYQHIDFALLPYGGGSGYPSCYLNLTDEEKIQEKERILKGRLESFVNNVNYLKPKYVMPFADQYLVAGNRSHLNKYISHAVSPGVVEDYIKGKEFKSNLLLLNSGQTFDFNEGEKIPNVSYKKHTDEDRESYIRSLKEIKYDYEHFALNPAVPLDRLVNFARARLWKMQQQNDYCPDFKLYLDANDSERRFCINMLNDTAEEISFSKACEKPYLRIAVPDTLLMMLLVGHVSWNIADAALFLDYERVPNIYDGKIYEYLNYLRV